ncbi:MarR family winged helix-turn-helix transcriptional regulator [Nocardia sp. NPDC088792]|uniref:MarR family winged helix-turn-helix transcriptional regulator n=1 Tax=Nocardia sp. NPDC088792 TaxID=3364332 RepID=UPI0038302B7E
MSDPTPASELRLLDALFRLSKTVLADARTHVVAAADLDLADFLVLRSIELGVDTPGDLVRDLGLNPAVVSRALTKLAKAGFVDRSIDPEDSRRSRVALTAEGARTNASIAARVRPGLAQRLDRLDPDRVRILLETLEML